MTSFARTGSTATGIAYDAAGDQLAEPVLLLHAAVADRRMWEPQFHELALKRRVVRCDLRGFGDSARRPIEALCHYVDVLTLLDELDIDRVHLIGNSMGAGVAAEVAVAAPDRVASLLLVAPGGALLNEVTPQLRQFFAAEREALNRGDIDAAVDANVRWWVDGPRRGQGVVPARVRTLVATMQRRAFELTADWDDVDEKELEPPVVERLEHITCPTLVVQGRLDIDAIFLAALHVVRRVPDASLVEWDSAAHLPSLELPAEFLDLTSRWLATLRAGDLK